MKTQPVASADEGGARSPYQKPAKGVPAYTLYVNRPLGGAVAKLGARRGTSPNLLTIASAALTVLAIALVALVEPRLWVTALVGVLLAAGYVLDSADGQLARMTGRSSLSGEWLDHVLDGSKIVAVHGAVLVSLYRFSDSPDLVLAMPLLYQVVATTIFSAALADVLLRRARDAAIPTPDQATNPPASVGRSSILRSVIYLPLDFGVLGWVVVLLPFTSVFLVVYGLLLLANTGFLVVAFRRRYRGLQT